MNKWFIIVFLVGLIMSVLREWFVKILLLVVICIVAWYLIRWIADMYWWGKDNDKF